MNILNGKVAIVTGASSGIGYASAKRFASEGARLVLAARRQAELDLLVAEIEQGGGSAVALAGDVRSGSYARALVELAVDHFGRLDIAFNNAGSMSWLGDSRKVKLSEWEQTLNTNLTSAFLAARYQLPALLKQETASLIFTSSFVGHTVGFPQTAAYAASKAGIIGLTQALAAEFGANGLRVNALLPGATETPMLRAFATTPESIEFVQGLPALKRIASPDEIAEAALFLASESSSFVTGTAFLVDGGISITRT